jgi:CHAT domain-containing protein
VNQTPDKREVNAAVQTERLWMDSVDLSSKQKRARFIHEYPCLIQAESVAHMAASVPRLIGADKHRALWIAELTVTIASRLNSPEAMAQSLRAKGNALYGLSRNKAAVTHHGTAIQLFRSTGNLDQVARTLSSSIQPLILLSLYDRAFAAALEARTIFSEQNNPLRLARLELNLGNIFDRRDRPEEALACYESAYQYLSAHGQDDPDAVAVALHNIAVSCVRLNNFRRALAVYAQAREFAAKHAISALVLQSDYNVASLHYLRGDYAQAISLLRQVRDDSSSAGDRYHFALCHLDLSEIYLELNLSAEAASAAEHAGEAFQQLGMRYERGKALANMAIALGQQGHTAQALQLFSRVRRMFVKERNKVMPSLIDLYRAVVLVDEKRDAEALRLCTASLTSFRRHKLSSKAALCRLLLGRVYLRRGSLVLARQQCTRAANSMARLDSPALNYHLQALTGEIEGALGHDRRSYDSYRRAHDSLERMRGRIQSEELKISFMKQRVEIYEALVTLCLKRGQTKASYKEAFGYIQQAKSRTLLDFVFTEQPMSWQSNKGQTEHAKQIQQLREELNWYFHKTETSQLQSASPHELATLRKESSKREVELLRLSREHGFNDRTDARSQDSVPLTVDQVRHQLAPGTTVLEYFELQDRFVVLVLSGNQVEVVTLAETSEISQLIELLQFQMSKHRLGPEYIETYGKSLLRATQANLKKLYRLLIEPIRTLLHADHLVIAPHGILHNLPFHALFEGQQYLIDEFTISYAPSASIYAACQASPRREDNSSLLLGIEDEAVPFVKDEIEAVAQYLPNPTTLLGSSATSKALRVQGEHSRYIHIASHGYFRQDNPLFSGIRLGDSCLSVYDLYQLKLRAELVTLSGCSTGLNKVVAGDELLGLVRGLMHAGAQSSLLTLWDVQDRSTALLITHFYSHLSSTGSTAKSLQRAMQQLKMDYLHPYYWAPFMLIGKTSSKTE